MCNIIGPSLLLNLYLDNLMAFSWKYYSQHQSQQWKSSSHVWGRTSLKADIVISLTLSCSWRKWIGLLRQSSRKQKSFCKGFQGRNPQGQSFVSVQVSINCLNSPWLMIFKTPRHQVSLYVVLYEPRKSDVLQMNNITYTQNTSTTVTDNYALCHSVIMKGIFRWGLSFT